MCIIAYCKNEKLSTDQILNCWYGNRDGAGMAWVEGGKVHVRKGFMTLKDFTDFYAGFDKYPHVVHFRIGTSGGNTAELTHPFVVSKDSPTSTEYEGTHPVLFHNGVFSEWQAVSRDFFLRTLQKVPEGQFNDTRALAVVLNTLGINALQFIDGNNKFVVVQPECISVFGDFVQEGGIMFSNSGFRSCYSAPKKDKNGIYRIDATHYVDSAGYLLEGVPEPDPEDIADALRDAEEDERERAIIAARKAADDRDTIVVKPGSKPAKYGERTKIDIDELAEEEAWAELFKGAGGGRDP